MTIKTRAPVKLTKVTSKTLSKQKKNTDPKSRSIVSESTNLVKEKDLSGLADEQVSDVIQAQNSQALAEGQAITGRGVFAVRTLGDAVSVEAAFLVEDGNVLRLPAVFPNREYAMAQIEELRQIMNQHFDEIDLNN